MKINSAHVNRRQAGGETQPFRTEHNLHRGRLFLNPSTKLDKAATVTLFTLERCTEAIRFSVRPQSYWSYEWLSRPGIPSSFKQRRANGPGDPLSSFPLCQKAAQRFLCLWWRLMLIWSYTLPPDISWNCPRASLKDWECAAEYVLRGQAFPWGGRTVGSEVADGKVTTFQ